jgi:hypothetical protein
MMMYGFRFAGVEWQPLGRSAAIAVDPGIKLYLRLRTRRPGVRISTGAPLKEVYAGFFAGSMSRSKYRSACVVAHCRS